MTSFPHIGVGSDDAGGGDRVTAEDAVDRVLESMPVGFMAVDHDWRVTYLNPAGAAVVGTTSQELVGRSYWEAFPATVDSEFGRTYREVAATRQPATVEAFYPDPLNAWFEVQAVPTPTGIAFYFTQVTERRMSQDRLALLARVSAELAGALDSDTAVNRLARLVTPVLGEGCVLTVMDLDGRPRVVTSWHVDPIKRDLLERYTALRLAAATASAPVVRSLLGETVSATGDELLALLPDGEARDLLARLAPRSGLSVPVRGRDRTLGALTLFSDHQEVRSEADLVAAREVADRIGLAVDNARLFRQQRALAEGLQRSLLSAPFEPDHAEIVVRYLPAAEAARVGGDWYDAFLQPSGSTMLVIGDVVGHDTAAAAAMGQLRGLLRGIAVYSDEGPAEVLCGLDAAMTQLQLHTYATAAVARFEQTREEVGRGVTRMRWANAGHPPLLVIRPGGSLDVLGKRRGEMMLGVDGASLRSEQVVTLARGSTVLLFTDGLIERRNGDLDSGMARLQAAVAELAELPLQRLCDELVERMVDGRPEDDVALVAIRLHRQDRPRPAEAGPLRIPPTVPRDPASGPG
jgi:PAS domain S-box-containing protein